MSLPQWKAYFSMHVLGQTDPIYNSTIHLERWYLHQSCPWLAEVTTFELKHMNECYGCGHSCKGDYCTNCAIPCYDCGEVGCGGYCILDRCPGCEGGRGDRCRWCKRDDQY